MALLAQPLLSEKDRETTSTEWGEGWEARAEATWWRKYRWGLHSLTRPSLLSRFFFSLIISRLSFQAPPFIRVLASFDHSCFRGTNPVSEIWFQQYHAQYSAPCTPVYAGTKIAKIVNRIAYLEISHRVRRTKFINVENKRGRVIVILIIYTRAKGLRENCSYDREIYLCP